MITWGQMRGADWPRQPLVEWFKPSFRPLNRQGVEVAAAATVALVAAGVLVGWLVMRRAEENDLELDFD